MLVLAHVNKVLLDEMVTVGGVLFNVVVTDEVAVQPFAVFVTVTSYVAPTVTNGFDAVAKNTPFWFHTCVVPPSVGTDKTVFGLAHVNDKPLLADIVASGAVMSCVIEYDEDVAEHPLDASVPVTAYAPGVVTFIEDVVAPVLHK